MQRKNKGLSLVIGVMLILILFFSLAAAQLLSLENYVSSARTALAIEEEADALVWESFGLVKEV